MSHDENCGFPHGDCLFAEETTKLRDELAAARSALATVQSWAAEGVPPAGFGRRMKEIYDHARAARRRIDDVLRPPLEVRGNTE